MRPTWRGVALGTAAFGAACVAYGTFVESAAFRVRRFTAPVLPPGAASIRVLHVSDVHLLPWHARRREFLRSLAGLEPDLVISTGDSLASAAALEPFVADLGRLLLVPGAFVFGSNDYNSAGPRNPLAYLWRTTGKDHSADSGGTLPTDELQRALASGGWLDLNNAAGRLDVRGTPLHLRGTADAHENRDDYALVAGPAPDEGLALGVTHAPYRRILDPMTADGVSVIFAGHTHGGQVCVPGYGALTSNSDLPPSHARGLFRHDAGGRSSWVHVSAGMGMSPYAPFRFACPPEVSLLSLVARPK